ncbi:MAG: cell division protein ZapD [Gammaproteobacteria bacterium]|nr:cell division protein ZapD [Gammaproteobacteria bacterium]
MLVVGLTGGIGSGKSTVAELFAKRGINVIDADIVARELVEPGQAALHDIIDTFGRQVLNAEGRLNRSALREIVFNDSSQRAKLESILHPRIRTAMLEQLENVKSEYCLFVIPLLVDTGYWDMIDKITVVDLEEHSQIERVIARDGVSREQVANILDAQISREERVAAADYIINNEQNSDTLDSQVEHLHQEFLNLTRQKYNTPAPQNANTEEDRVIYEHPLTERIRTFLRLENLFNRADYHLQQNSEWDAHALVHTLVELTNLANRGDLKSEIIKELERQQSAIARNRTTPHIERSQVEKILIDQQLLLKNLLENREQLGQHMKTDGFFSTLRQRLSIPGGACEFDLPAYAHWLRLNGDQRRKIAEPWLTPFKTAIDAISLCLNVIRQSTPAQAKIAGCGFFEESLQSHQDTQLLRVFVPKTLSCYPAISAGRHRFSIRFLQATATDLHSGQSDRDIRFQLALCGF